MGLKDKEKQHPMVGCVCIALGTCLCLLFSGGMQDYNYVWANCFEITLELSCCKYPPTSELPKEWENNRESLLAFIEKVARAGLGVGVAAVKPVCPWWAGSTVFRCPPGFVCCVR